MKEFVVYTALRLLLFVAALAVVLGGWSLVGGTADVFWALVIALLLSGIASYVLLARQRDAFARKVEARAQKATARFEERRAKEDDDGPQA